MKRTPFGSRSAAQPRTAALVLPVSMTSASTGTSGAISSIWIGADEGNSTSERAGIVAPIERHPGASWPGLVGLDDSNRQHAPAAKEAGQPVARLLPRHRPRRHLALHCLKVWRDLIQPVQVGPGLVANYPMSQAPQLVRTAQHPQAAVFLAGRVEGYSPADGGYSGKTVCLSVRFWVESRSRDAVTAVMEALKDAFPCADFLVQEFAASA